MAKPAKCISVADARDLYNQWQSTRENEIHRTYPQDPSDFTFDLAELQEYLDYVKDQSTKQSINNPGIRIYFGAYNDVNNTDATVFLAPTDGSTNLANNNYNIDPYNFGTGGWPPNSY